MRWLSPEGQRKLEDLAARHGFSPDATRVLLDALIAGGGGMAQFNHPELGGAGQWMRGGLSQIGDMFNSALKARVDSLFADLAAVAAREADAARNRATRTSDGQPDDERFGARDNGASGRWWPGEWGEPDSAGSQDDSRYAYFARSRRLAIETRGVVTFHDTLDHRIGGASQSRSGRDGSLAFTSQHGTVDVRSLPVVSLIQHSAAAPVPAPPPSSGTGASEVLATIEGLADLRAKGILSDDEFTTKKTELLARL